MKVDTAQAILAPIVSPPLFGRFAPIYLNDRRRHRYENSQRPSWSDCRDCVVRTGHAVREDISSSRVARRECDAYTCG